MAACDGEPTSRTAHIYGQFPQETVDKPLAKTMLKRVILTGDHHIIDYSLSQQETYLGDTKPGDVSADTFMKTQFHPWEKNLGHHVSREQEQGHHPKSGRTEQITSQ
jgi:hypothetical protein